MTTQQAIKYLESIPAEKYCKYADSWGRDNWRMPTEILFAQYIINSESGPTQAGR